MSTNSMKRIVVESERCPSCGGPMVYWLPDDMDVAAVSRRVKAATTITPIEIDAQSPLPAGRYCPLGCIGQMFNLGNEELLKSLETERRNRETASVIVRPATPNETPLRDFKIYLDRYIRRTAPCTAAPRHCEYIELEPGDHTIVVRDFDHLRPARRESNTLPFNIAAQQQIAFVLAVENGELKLRLDV